MPNYDIYIGASPIDIYVSAAQATVGGAGASAFTDLTDKATADIPTINTPVATALNLRVPKTTTVAGKALSGNITIDSDDISDATESNTASKLVKRSTEGRVDLGSVRLQSGSYYGTFGMGAPLTGSRSYYAPDRTGTLAVTTTTNELGFSPVYGEDQELTSLSFVAKSAIERTDYNEGVIMHRSLETLTLGSSAEILPPAYLGTGEAWSLTRPRASGNIAVTGRTDGVPDALASGVPITAPTIIGYTESVVAIGTVVSSHTLAITAGTVLTATLTASTACTFTMPTAAAGKSFILFLKQAASTGNGTATFTGVKWSGGTAPTITATAGRMDILAFTSDGTNWYGSFTQNFTP